VYRLPCVNREPHSRKASQLQCTHLRNQYANVSSANGLPSGITGNVGWDDGVAAIVSATSDNNGIERSTLFLAASG